LYDVIVIGSGPAGCAASKKCAELGMRTLMVDRRLEIGAPLRDFEIVSRDGLQSLGINIEKHWLDLSFRKIQIIFGNARSTVILDDMEICSIEADKFEKHIAALSSRAGADIMIKTEAVSLVMEEGKVSGVRLRSGNAENEEKCGIVIFAGGVDSPILHGIPELAYSGDKVVARTLQRRVVADFGKLDSIDLYPGDDLRYIFAVIPKGDNLANVVLVSRDVSIDAVRYMSDFMDNVLKLKKWGSLQDVSSEVHSGKIPQKLGVPGLILAGDSTGINCDNWVMGIENAYSSGVWAAEAAKKMIENEVYEEPTEYRKKIMEVSGHIGDCNFKEKLDKLDADALRSRLTASGTLHFQMHGSLLDILDKFL